MGKIKKIKLLSKNKIPQYGFGTWLLKPEDVELALSEAIEAGYTMIDTAQIYNNEYQIGQVLKTEKRSKLFITTKIWASNFGNTFEASFKESLRRLGLPYVDLMLLHWPTDTEHDISAWKKMIQAQKDGLTKCIGVSNYDEERLQKLIDATGVAPEVNQIYYSPLNTYNSLVQYCRKHKIAIEGYSILRPYIESEKGKRETRTEIMTNDQKNVIEQIAAKYKKTPTQIILRWAVQNKIIVFPKSTNTQRVRENINIFDFKIKEGDMALINIMNKNESYLNRINMFKASVPMIDFEKGLLYDTNFNVVTPAILKK